MGRRRLLPVAPFAERNAWRGMEFDRRPFFFFFSPRTDKQASRVSGQAVKETPSAAVGCIACDEYTKTRLQVKKGLYVCVPRIRLPTTQFLLLIRQNSKIVYKQRET